MPRLQNRRDGVKEQMTTMAKQQPESPLEPTALFPAILAAAAGSSCCIEPPGRYSEWRRQGKLGFRGKCKSHLCFLKCPCVVPGENCTVAECCNKAERLCKPLTIWGLLKVGMSGKVPVMDPTILSIFRPSPGQRGACTWCRSALLPTVGSAPQ